jgi:hypothetical protein
MYGRTGNSVVPRQSTGFTDLSEAEAMRDALIAKSKSETVHGLRIEECIEKHLASHKHEPGEKTYGQYRLHLGRLQDYCERQGVYFMHELTVDLLEKFRVDGLLLSSGHFEIYSRREACFLRDAYRRGWITEPLVERVKTHRAVYDQKEPYSDEEVEQILNEAINLNGGTRIWP